MSQEAMKPPVRRPCISIEEFEHLAPGDIITYYLAPHHQPTNPFREWHGQVKDIVHKTRSGRASAAVMVFILDKGYENEQEAVGRTEIIAVEKHSATDTPNVALLSLSPLDVSMSRGSHPRLDGYNYPLL